MGKVIIRVCWWPLDRKCHFHAWLTARSRFVSGGSETRVVVVTDSWFLILFGVVCWHVPGWARYVVPRVIVSYILKLKFISINPLLKTIFTPFNRILFTLLERFGLLRKCVDFANCKKTFYNRLLNDPSAYTKSFNARNHLELHQKPENSK